MAPNCAVIWRGTRSWLIVWVDCLGWDIHPKIDIYRKIDFHKLIPREKTLKNQLKDFFLYNIRMNSTINNIAINMNSVESENTVLAKLYNELTKLENEKIEHSKAIENDSSPEVIKAHCKAIEKIEKTIEAIKVRIQKNEERAEKHQQKEAERVAKEAEKEKVRLAKEELNKSKILAKEQQKLEKAEKRKLAEICCKVNFEFPTSPFDWFQFFQMMNEAEELYGKKFDEAMQKICTHWNSYYYKILNRAQYRMYNSRTDEFDVVSYFDLKQQFDSMKAISERIYYSIIQNQPQYEFIYEKNTVRFSNYSDSHGLINLCPLYKVLKLYEKEFNADAWNQYENLKIWNDYLHNELCDKNEEQIKFIEQWIARTLRGIKNESCLIMRGKNGIGKSTMSKMICRMLDKSLWIESMSSDALSSQFNAEVENKVFICLEEMHSKSVADWTVQSNNLKAWCTGENILMQAKCKDRVQINNSLNITLNTNEHTIIKEAGVGRRFLIMDMSDRQKGKVEYWKRLYDNCINNPDFCKFYYNYMTQIVYDKDYNTREVPATLSKKELTENEKKNTEPIAYFLLQEFYKKNLPINTESLKLLMNDYGTFAKEELGSHWNSSQELSKLRECDDCICSWEIVISNNQIFYGKFFRLVFELYRLVIIGEECKSFKSPQQFYNKLEDYGFKESEYRKEKYKHYDIVSIEQLKLILQDVEIILQNA